MTAPPPPGAAAPLALAPSAAAAARGAPASTPSTRGVTLLRYEFVPAGVDAAGTARLEVDERTGEHTLTRPGAGGKPPTRFGGHAAARRPASGSLDGGGRPADAAAEATDDDVECVAVYDGARWTLHAVEAAVGLRVQRAGGGDAAAAARRPVVQPSNNDDDDATTSDDELGAELEAALEEEEGAAAPAAAAAAAPVPARHTLPAAELNDVELEFLGRK